MNRKASVTITVTAPAVRSVTVSPSSAILKPGDTQAFVANVDADPGVARTVTWSSTNTAAATVSTTGVVTAVAPGSTSIVATSTVNTTVTGAAAVTVRPPVAAAISISNITQANTPGSPTVNANNVFGAIDVNLNVDPGEQIVTRAEVLIDGVVACFQNLSLAQSEALRIAGAFGDVEAAIVSCQINTAAFNSTTGAVSYANGNHTLSARAIIQGGTQTATPSSALIFNNQSGFVAIVTNTNTVGGPASAINPTTGRKWVQGHVTLQLAAVNYAPGGATVTTINAQFLGKTFSDTPDAGTQIFTSVFPDSGTGALEIDDYETAANSETIPAVTNSNLSTGNPGPTQILNVGAKADTLGLVRLDSTRVDNVIPAAPTVGPFPIWLNAAFTFDSTSAGISNISDTGVDNVTVDFYVILGTNPSSSCSLTGMTKVTASAGLTENIVSTAYQGKVVLSDALGNRRCAPLGNSFGNDFTPPNNVTLTFSDGNTNNFAYNAVSPAVNYILASTGDNASGISSTNPAWVSILRNNSTGSPTCVFGVGTACAQDSTLATDNITKGNAGQGYYNFTAQLADVAGNRAPTPAFTRLFLVDATAPTFTGNVGMNAQYSGNAPAAFTNLLANDNLDLNQLFGVVSYTAAGIILQYPSQSLGSFGLPLEKTFSGTYTIPSLIRCINPANTFAVNAAAEAQQITFSATDQAGNAGTVAPVAGALLAALDNCGAVGNLPSPAIINTFNDSTVVYPGSGTRDRVSKSGLTTGTNSPTVSLTAIADVSLDNAPEPFTRVEFYFQNAAGNLVLIGQSGPGVLNQTVTQPHLDLQVLVGSGCDGADQRNYHCDCDRYRRAG